MPAVRYRMVIVGMLILCGGFIAAFSEKKQAKFKFIFPQDRTIILEREVNLICVLEQDNVPMQFNLPKLFVNNSEKHWDKSFKLPVLVARIKLQLGLNKIKVGDATLSVYVKDGSTKKFPEGWKELRYHPQTVKGQYGCASCHKTDVQYGNAALGEPPIPAACDKCHSELEFELKHHHPKQPIEQCTMCHSIHSANIKGLLKEPSKQLCAQCHD
ncbi:MAG: cytochrome c3 family protein [Armatimonadota bacterium]|nr:hypothetical protein [Armatimonadota bacterium]MCX7776759.1 hypothetical protein [Armatimonadota bacterium]MDW8024557.1 cytochrome c3 family protein [Armatimonadota bacterium]